MKRFWILLKKATFPTLQLWWYFGASFCVGWVLDSNVIIHFIHSVRYLCINKTESTILSLTFRFDTTSVQPLQPLQNHSRPGQPTSSAVLYEFFFQTGFLRTQSYSYPSGFGKLLNAGFTVQRVVVHSSSSYTVLLPKTFLQILLARGESLVSVVDHWSD